ncbi:MAG: hypothetical protein GY762_03385 [Proteobacteria bacterium]|nr:hypothetical protein [Pseudomonadota bacterium]
MLIARCLLTILPRLTEAEVLDVTRIYSVADQLSADTFFHFLCTRPPVSRAPPLHTPLAPRLRSGRVKQSRIQA